MVAPSYRNSFRKCGLVFGEIRKYPFLSVWCPFMLSRIANRFWPVVKRLNSSLVCSFVLTFMIAPSYQNSFRKCGVGFRRNPENTHYWARGAHSCCRVLQSGFNQKSRAWTLLQFAVLFQRTWSLLLTEIRSASAGWFSGKSGNTHYWACGAHSCCRVLQTVFDQSSSAWTLLQFAVLF